MLEAVLHWFLWGLAFGLGGVVAIVISIWLSHRLPSGRELAEFDRRVNYSAAREAVRQGCEAGQVALVLEARQAAATAAAGAAPVPLDPPAEAPVLSVEEELARVLHASLAHAKLTLRVEVTELCRGLEQAEEQLEAWRADQAARKEADAASRIPAGP